VARVNSLTGVNPTSNLGANMQGIIFGALLILTMLFVPRGIASIKTPIQKLLRTRRPRPNFLTRRSNLITKYYKHFTRGITP